MDNERLAKEAITCRPESKERKKKKRQWNEGGKAGVRFEAGEDIVYYAILCRKKQMLKYVM